MTNNNKLPTILIALLLSTAIVSAEEPELSEEDLLEDFHENIDLDEFKQEVNQNQEELPSFVSRIVDGQRINVEFRETNETYSASMNGTLIEELGYESLDNPTLEVKVNESSLTAVMGSEQPFDELREQLDEGGISYEAKTNTNRVKFYITEKVINILSRFGAF